MKIKVRQLLISVIIILFIIFAFSALHKLPLNIFPVQQKPESESQPDKNYDYYIIIDEVDGHSLMYVPLIVNVGDEVLTDENKRYKVVGIDGNKASARYVEDVNLQKYQKK